MIAGYVDRAAGTPRRSAAFAREQSSRPRSCDDQLLGVRPLHLDDDPLAVLEHRAMNLRDRPGGQRVGLDAREHVLPRHAQLSLHDRDDLGLGQRRHPVLQLRSSVTIAGGRRSGRVERICPSLRERRSELLERGAELLRAGRRVAASSQSAGPVARQDTADLPRPPEQVGVRRLRA